MMRAAREPVARGATVPSWREYGWGVGLLALILMWAAALVFNPAAGDWFGIGLHDGWFTDLHAVLAAGEAHVQGIPIHRVNPLDMFGRPHSYPSCWLVLGTWGFTRADTFWLGLWLVACFLLVALVMHRPRSLREMAWGALFLLAPVLQLALARANNDLVIFLVLAPLAACVASPRMGVRFVAVVLVTAATALKYYPAVAGILLLGEAHRRLFWSRLGAGFVLFAAVGWSVYEDTRHFATSLPTPSGIFAFGAPEGLALLGHAPSFGWTIVAVLVVVAIAPDLRAPAPVGLAPDRAELGFILGAALLAGCFWVAMNWGYRWVFALWLLPVLLRGYRPDFVLRRWEHRALLGLLPVCLWADGLSCFWWNLGGGRMLAMPVTRFTDLVWMALQPVHWVVFSLFTVACARFAWRELRRSLAGAGPALPARA